MKNSSKYINDSVFKVNQDYSNLQNKTKELFFKCLEEGRSLDYFEKKLEKIWGKVNYKYYVDSLNEYAAIIHENNLLMLQVQETDKEETKKINDFFSMVSALAILRNEKRYKEHIKRVYKSSIKSPAYKNDKTNYLVAKVQRYNDNIVPYYHNGEVIRHVKLSTYCSMVHNTNMTRTAWNTSLNDADSLGYENFYIPFHAFSCMECLSHQNRVMSKEEVVNLVGDVSLQEGDILHPNCKCELLIYHPGLTYMNRPSYTRDELDNQYHIRQKVNSLTLEKDRVLTDMKIQRGLNAYDEYDKLNQKRNKINSQIRELKQELPTKELQKQVVAINR